MCYDVSIDFFLMLIFSKTKIIKTPIAINPIACISWGSPSKLKGETLFSFNGISIPLEFVLKVNGIFHGHILFKDPIMKPVITANVKRWYVSNNHFRSFENDNNPITAPTPIIRIVLKSLVLRASRTGLYAPMMTKIKAPEIPGKIIAQIAKAPAKNRNKLESDVSEGLRVVMK